MSRPRIPSAFCSASPGSSASLTPPAFPRPPVSTCALTTTGPPISSAAARASGAVRGGGTALPAAAGEVGVRRLGDERRDLEAAAFELDGRDPFAESAVRLRRYGCFHMRQRILEIFRVLRELLGLDDAVAGLAC